jgi:hypothetical protein
VSKCRGPAVSSVRLRERSHVTNPVPWLDRFGPLIPTLSDLAFVLPVLALFWWTTGVGWLLADSDTGWHIRTGEWILSNGRIPKTDVFSFTMLGERWIAWEWLSDVVMGLAYHTGGLAAVVWLAMFLLGATSACVYKGAVAEADHRLIAIALTWLAVSASIIHWLARPHLVTPLMAAIFCRILNRVETNRDRISLWSLPLLTIVWTNLHGGFFVGIVLVLTYAIGAGGEELRCGSRGNAWFQSRKYVLSALGCMLASLLNPFGYHLHIHIAQYLGTSFYFARIGEFQSIDFHSFTVAYFETLLILSIAAAAWHLRSGRLTHSLLLLSWSHLALFSARNIPIFAVVAVPSVSLAIREWLNSDIWLHRLKRNISELERDLHLIAGQCGDKAWHLAPCFTFLVLAVLLDHPGHQNFLRARFDDRRFPVSAAGFLAQRPDLSLIRLYSSWQWGGYLIYRLWPSISVFDDGRTDFYGPTFVENGLQVWNATSEWHNTLEHYQVNAALLPLNSALAAVLRERPDWKPIYEDRTAVFFAKIEAKR